MKLIIPVLVLILLTGTVFGVDITIAQARVDANGDGIPDLLGQTVTIVGIATCDGTTFGDISCYVQDETAGINVYAYDPPSSGPIIEGQQYRITGEIKQYNGLTEISPASEDDYQYLGNPGIPESFYAEMPANYTIDESYEGELMIFGDDNPMAPRWVTVANEPESGGGWNFNVWNGSIDIAVHVSDDTGIDISEIHAGTRLIITGIGGQYDSEPPYTSGYQLLPRKQSDLVIFNPTIQDGFHLSLLTPNPFAPSIGETITIEYNGTGMRLSLTVFDRAGREMITLADSRPTGDMIIWNGKDDRNVVLPAGPYILLLEGVDSEGKRYTTTETVVVATPMN